MRGTSQSCHFSLAPLLFGIFIAAMKETPVPKNANALHYHFGHFPPPEFNAV
jgi:hypothetical protein